MLINLFFSATQPRPMPKLIPHPYIYISIYIYVCIYIYRERERYAFTYAFQPPCCGHRETTEMNPSFFILENRDSGTAITATHGTS